jgi:hypothetical protein
LKISEILLGQAHLFQHCLVYCIPYYQFCSPIINCIFILHSLLILNVQTFMYRFMFTY